MWNKTVFCLLICIGAFGYCLYSYVDQQNAVTRLRLEIPVLAKQIKDIREENTRLHYEIELFESPENLMQLAHSSEFAHLRHPLYKEILTLQQGVALQIISEEKEVVPSQLPKVKFAIGAKQ